MDASVSYAAHVLPAIMVYGFAIPFIGVPNTIAAIRDVPAERAGTASGLVNASFQVGGAIGVAAVTALATSHATALLAGGSSQAEALAGGYARGFAATADRRRVSVWSSRSSRAPRCASMPRRASRPRPTWSPWPRSRPVWQSPAP